MKIKTLAYAAAILAMTCAATQTVHAQEYPSKPIRLVVPFSPGGGNDNLARLFGQKLTESWGEAVVVENRPGAGTTIAAAHTARAAPDGYTLMLSSIASHAVSPSLYRNPGYDPIKSFTPIAMLGIAPVIMAINPSNPATTVAEFIELAKADPGKYTYASGGVGSVMHTSAMVFSQVADVELLHVPYRGAGPAYVALLANEVDLVIDTAAALMPMIISGKVRPLAIASKTRSKEAPDIPTFAEAGLPGYEANGWYSIHGPAGIPPAVANKLNLEINRIANLPDVQERLRQLGTQTVADNTPERLTEFVQSELVKYTEVIKAAGIVPE
ncbi:MAG: tripartite tricarboxylate transporter substrate binding protein [Pusillimonas sp.]